MTTKPTEKKAAVDLPSALEWLAGLGLAKDELLRRVGIIKAKFPAGEVPIAFIENLVRQAVGPAVVQNIIASVTADLMEVGKTGKSKIKRDDSALA